MQASQSQRAKSYIFRFGLNRPVLLRHSNILPRRGGVSIVGMATKTLPRSARYEPTNVLGCGQESGHSAKGLSHSQNRIINVKHLQYYLAQAAL